MKKMRHIRLLQQTMLLLTTFAALMVACQSRSDEAQLTISQEPSPSEGNSADAMASSYPTIEGTSYPTIEALKAALEGGSSEVTPSHGDEKTLQASAETAEENAPPTANTSENEKSVLLALATDQPEQKKEVMKDKNDKDKAASVHSQELSEQCAFTLVEEAASTDHLATSPSVLFAHYPLATGFEVSSIPLLLGDAFRDSISSTASMEIKTQSMGMEFAGGLSGELDQFKALDGGAHIAMPFIAFEPIKNLEYLMVDWQVMVKISGDSEEKSHLTNHLSSALLALLNDGFTLELSDQLQFRPDELAFEELPPFTSKVIKKTDHDLVFAHVKATTCLNSLIHQKVAEVHGTGDVSADN